MALAQPIFEGGVGFDGSPTYTPITPGTPAPPPIPVAPTPTPGPAPASAAPPPPIPQKAPTNLPTPELTPAPRFTQDDYAGAARTLLPRGRAWSTDPTSVQGKMLRGLVAVMERIDGIAGGLLKAAVPGRVTPLLPEWEATRALPDPCLGGTPSFEQRAAQVQARFVAVGGLSRQRYIDFAAALGFTIEIVNYAPFRVGLSTVENAVAGDEWYFVWGVRIVASGSLGTDVLLCELERIKPADTTIILLN